MPLPVEIVVTDEFPDPPNVKLKFPVIANVELYKLKLPDSELMLEFEFKVINPPYALTSEIFLKAPPELMPLPFNVKGSAPIIIPPDNSKAAPFATMVLPLMLPRASLLEALNTPAEIVVVPE